MKKILFGLLSLISFGALFAQNSIIIFDIDPNVSVTENSIGVSGQRISGNGAYAIVLEYREPGQIWMRTDTNFYGNNFNAVFTKIATGLLPETDYEVRFKAYNVLFTDSSVSAVKTATTLPVPTPPTIIINNIVEGLPNSLIIFDYEAVYYDALVTAYNALNGQVIGVPMMVAPGVSTDTFVVSNQPGQTHVLFLVIDPVINGLPIAQSATITVTAPSLVKPQLGLWSIDYRGVDSLRASISVVNTGNGGPITIRSSIKEENGTWAHNFDDVVGNSLTVGKGGLLPNTYYRITAIAESSAGSDTASILVNTNQIPGPTVTISNTEKTKNSVSFKINVDPNGNFAGSTVSEVGLVENGDTAIYQTTFQVAGTLSVNKTGKIPNTTYTYSGWVKNDAGLISNLPQFSITTDPPVQAIAPQWGSLFVESPSHISIQSIGYNVTSGDNAQLLGMIRKDGTTVWDTLIIQGGLTGSGTLDANFNGLIGGTKYWFKIAMKSSDGDIAINGTERWEITIAPQNPDVFEIVINSLDEYAVSFTIPGNGNGTLTSLKFELFEISTGFSIEDQTISVGTGSFSYGGNFSGLQPETDYEIKVTASGPNNSNPMAISKFFTTLGTVGIQEVDFEKLDSNIQMVGYDILGRILDYGTKKDLLEKFKNQVIFIGPRDEELLKKFGVQKMMSIN